MTVRRALSKRSVLAVLGAVASAVVVAALLAAPEPSPAQVKKPPAAQPMKVAVDPVIKEPLKQTVPVIGRLVAHTTSLAARINGPVGAAPVEVGDRVKIGDPVAVLVADLLQSEFALRQADVRQITANVRTQKAKIALRRQELKRLQMLRDSAAFSQARLDDKRQEVVVAESEAAEAEAKLAAAEAALALARTNLHNAVVRAPIPGVIAKRFVEVGTYLKIGDPVVSIVNDADFEIEADVPSQYTAALTPSRRIAIAFSNGSTAEARVRAVVPEENPQTRTRTARFVPDMPADPSARRPQLSNLAEGQSVMLQIPIARAEDVVTVHKDAVLTRDGGRVVYLVHGDDALARNVILGDAVGNRFIVKSGLKPGDLVVVRGNERLRPGQKVMYEAGRLDGAKKDADQLPAVAKPQG